MDGVVRTVTGDVDPAGLGRVDYHEHLFQVSPLLPGDELDDEVRSTREAGLLAASGFDAMVDATPIGLGRRPLALARASGSTGLRIVATTGVHRDEHYRGDAWIRSMDSGDLIRLLVRDIADGMPESDDRPDAASTSVRAGILKAGIGYWRISPYESRVLDAIAGAHRVTGAAVMVHLEYGTAAHEVLDALEHEGVAPHRVALAHVDRNLDPGLHRELAQRGALLGYDGPARARSAPDSAVLDCLSAVVDSGMASHLLLGGDVARSSRYIAYGGMPGLAYLGDRFVPRLRERVGPEVAEMILRDNPARWLTFS